MRKSISVAIIARNEEANLPCVLASIRWADEIVLVDSGSTDRTLTLAQEFGARVFEEPWKGFAEQKNSAIAHCTSEWILSLDADEEVTPELAHEIAELLATEPAYDAYFLLRLNHFLGRPIRHGGYWPDPKLRLFRRGAASFEQRPVHETMKATGPTGRLNGHLAHHCYQTLDEYLEHMNRYSYEGARLLVQKKRTSRSLLVFICNAILNPAATFAYNYFIRLGFLDGREGLILHWNHSSVYVHGKYVKAWQMGRQSSEI